MSLTLEIQIGLFPPFCGVMEKQRKILGKCYKCSAVGLWSNHFAKLLAMANLGYLLAETNKAAAMILI